MTPRALVGGAVAVLLAGCPGPRNDASPALPPRAPEAPFAVVGDGQVKLSWSPVVGATSYAVYLATAAGVGPDTWSTLPGGARLESATDSLTVSGLADGTAYHFAVTSVGGAGEGGVSPEVVATPEADCACPGWQVCDSTRACVSPVGPGSYLPGVNYHALSNHWMVTPVQLLDEMFLPSYHLPGVRDAVRTQLAEMASSGVKVVKTSIWFVNDPGIADHRWGMQFPPSEQELRNIRAYAADVAATPTPDGVPLELYLSDAWLGAADFSFDTPATTLGWSQLSASEYSRRVLATLDGELDAIRGVYRSDGLPAVTLVHALLEFDTCATEDDSDPVCTWPGDSRYFHNSAWFMRSFYPHFVEKARAVGIVPSVYFHDLGGSEANVLDPIWRDPYLPQVDGHFAFAIMYRALRFMKLDGLPIPERIDFSTGVSEPFATYTTTATGIARLYDDLVALLPEFQAPPFRFGAAEVIRWADPSVRIERGKPFASEALLRRGLEYAAYWPEEPDTAPPSWDMEPLETGDVDLAFLALDPGFEDGTALPAGWSPHPDPSGATVASRAIVADAHGGDAVLRLDGTVCGGCQGVASDPVPVTPGRVALVRFWARSDVQESGGRPPSPDYSGMTVEVLGLSGGVETGTLLEFGTVHTAWTWRRFVGVVPIPAGVDSIRLRFALQNAHGGMVEVDDLH